MSHSNSSGEISPDIEVQNVLSGIKNDCTSDTDFRSKSESNAGSPKFFEFWQDGSRRSAFSPYTRPTTVLTNLQRGNVKTETATIIPEFSVHQLAAQGQLIPEMKMENVNEKDDHGLTPLMWASAYGQYPTVAMLIDKGADLNIVGNDGENPLLLASSNGHNDIVKLLIKKKMEINDADRQGNTALMYAAFNNHSQCADELLKNGADITLSNLSGETAYSLAVSKGSKQVQLMLERHMLHLLQNCL